MYMLGVSDLVTDTHELQTAAQQGDYERRDLTEYSKEAEFVWHVAKSLQVSRNVLCHRKAAMWCTTLRLQNSSKAKGLQN